MLRVKSKHDNDSSMSHYRTLELDRKLVHPAYLHPRLAVGIFVEEYCLPGLSDVRAM